MLTNRLIKFILIILIPFLHALHGHAQTINTDSLLKLVHVHNHDTINGNIYYELARNTYSSDTKNALIWAREGANYFSKSNSLHLMTRCMNIEAVCLLILDRQEESIKMHYKILKIREELKDTLALAETLTNIGNIYFRGQDREQALKFYRQAIAYAKKKNNTKLLATLNNNMGNYYMDKYLSTKKQSDKILAIQHLKEGIKYKEKLTKDKTLEKSYISLATFYYRTDNLSSALAYAKKSEKLALQNKNDEAMGSTKLLLCQIAIEQNDLEQAQTHLDELYLYIAKQKAFHILNAHDQDIVVLRDKIRNLRANTTVSATTDSLQENDYNHALLFSRQKLREELNIQYETEKKELENANLALKNKIIQDKAEKNKVLGIGALLFALTLLILIINLKKKNKALIQSEKSIHEQANMLHQQNIILRQSEAFKAKLFSIVSHDLKSPIHSLKLIIQMSSDQKLSNEDYAYLMNKLNEELDITSNLLNDLLYWAKAQMETQSISWDNFNLHNITEKCIHTLSPNVKLKQLEIQNLIPKDTMVMGDEMRCEFVIRNIIHNAIKYSNICASIEVGLFDGENEWDFYIKDNGIGISKERLEQLFTYSKSPQSSVGTNNEQGAGIGLLLCHDFIESLGWRLQVESELGQGTIFHIYIKKQIAFNQFEKENAAVMHRVA